tara:strand:+ start:163 stop:399 length:237 start_codon:yes stop_codon:yes gene_type:complete
MKKKVEMRENRPFAPSAIFPAFMKPTVITIEIIKIIGDNFRSYRPKKLNFEGRMSSINKKLNATRKVINNRRFIDESF